jgi:hypothetical protein
MMGAVPAPVSGYPRASWPHDYDAFHARRRRRETYGNPNDNARIGNGRCHARAQGDRNGRDARYQESHDGSSSHRRLRNR